MTSMPHCVADKFGDQQDCRIFKVAQPTPPQRITDLPPCQTGGLGGCGQHHPQGLTWFVRASFLVLGSGRLCRVGGHQLIAFVFIVDGQCARVAGAIRPGTWPVSSSVPVFSAPAQVP